MNIRPGIGPQTWEVVRTKLDQTLPFANMRDTPYYRDAVWEQFSKKEYERRYRALRNKMQEQKLDAVIVPGGPSHWSFGGGMLWLTGHWEWHALASYVLVPLEGDPTMIFSMGGTHAEAVRKQVKVAIQDVRHSRNGRYADVMVERIRELKLERGRIGLMEVDGRALRLSAGEPVQCAAREPAGRRAGLHQRLPARTALDPQQRGARLHPQGRRAVPQCDGCDGRARTPRRERI